jgi:hypothetical protein
MVVPASGNMSLCGQQFWLGSARAGQLVRFWASVDLIQLFIGGTRIRTVRSHLSVTDLARLVADGAVDAGPSPAVTRTFRCQFVKDAYSSRSDIVHGRMPTYRNLTR